MTGVVVIGGSAAERRAAASLCSRRIALFCLQQRGVVGVEL